MEITTKKQISLALNEYLQVIYQRDGSTQTDFWKQHDLNDGYVSSVKNGKVEVRRYSKSIGIEDKNIFWEDYYEIATKMKQIIDTI